MWIALLILVLIGAVLVGWFVGKIKSWFAMPIGSSEMSINPNAKAEFKQNLKRIEELKAQRKR